MASAAAILGKEAIEQAPRVAVVRCNGTPEFRPRLNVYNGAPTCAIIHNLYMGEGGCPHGCLGEGDCVTVCDFDAIHMDPVTGLPVVDDRPRHFEERLGGHGGRTRSEEVGLAHGDSSCDEFTPDYS